MHHTYAGTLPEVSEHTSSRWDKHRRQVYHMYTNAMFKSACRAVALKTNTDHGSAAGIQHSLVQSLFAYSALRPLLKSGSALDSAHKASVAQHMHVHFHYTKPCHLSGLLKLGLYLGHHPQGGDEGEA